MNTIPTLGEFTLATANDNHVGANPYHARMLARTKPLLALPPERLWNDHDWPHDAVETFNHAIISDRVARIGTALAAVHADNPDWHDNVMGACLHALLARHDKKPLPEVAMALAQQLHARAITRHGYHDPVGLADYLEMRKGKFSPAQAALGADMLRWAEHGVEQGAWHYDGPPRGELG